MNGSTVPDWRTQPQQDVEIRRDFCPLSESHMIELCRRKVPIPSGSSVVFNAAGYPGSQYVPLRTGEVQAAWSQGPSSTGEGYVLLWTTTYSFPGF